MKIEELLNPSLNRLFLVLNLTINLIYGMLILTQSLRKAEHPLQRLRKKPFPSKLGLTLNLKDYIRLEVNHPAKGHFYLSLKHVITLLFCITTPLKKCTQSFL